MPKKSDKTTTRILLSSGGELAVYCNGRGAVALTLNDIDDNGKIVQIAAAMRHGSGWRETFGPKGWTAEMAPRARRTLGREVRI